MRGIILTTPTPVLKDTSESESYRLSNLCKMKPDEDWDDVCFEYEEVIDDQTAREEQLAILEIDGTSPCANRKRAWPASFFNNRKFAHLSPQAYPMHDYCWRLLKMAVGEDAEDKLGSIIRCLENKWSRETLANLKARNKWTNGYAYTLCNDDQRKSHFGDNVEYRISLTDPEAVPEALELISEALQCKDQQRRKPTNDVSDHINYKPSYDASHSIFRNLPDDIVYMVLDYLPVSDCQSLFPIIGFIPPQSYWYRRVKRWSFFLPEIPKMKLDRDVDWGYLARRIEALMTESHGLLNRRRIISTILSVKEKVV